MFTLLKNFFHTTKQLGTFKELPEHYHRLVVYSEGSHDWPHMGSILKKFLEHNLQEYIAYFSSDKNDPGLSYMHERFKSFYIGHGSARTIFFKTLRAKLLLMTLPDLEIYHLKKSTYPVHYAYCFHSITSTHTVYRERAFEFYDSIFCVGPHHVAEMRREEELKGLKPRQLFEHGSVKLDTVLVARKPNVATASDKQHPFILLAPSWGTGSFAEDKSLVKTIIRNIVDQEWICRLRLHPMTLRHHPKLVEELQRKFSSYTASGQFAIEENLNDNSSLENADVMISDWSGVATEFAFGLEKPVLFIDTPQKINNPRWKDYGLPGVENQVRSEIGKILKPEDVTSLVPILEELISRKEEFKNSIATARERLVFNVGNSAAVGAKFLMQLLKDGRKDSVK
ncbi:CDP-glycerol glycerophosphotransferase family protein [Desulfococcaceae bacterium OttesenSCG-928-F15]|nr:CDP-glycerol glycerophosphotransferase family protein [Desulfococcaceae bacterium OttesenSCG-928-F15]